MPIAITEDQRAVQDSIARWARRAGPAASARALEPEAGHPAGGDQEWSGLADLGVFGIALPASVGGAGGSVVDLAAALEQLAEACAPGPILTTVLAGIVLTAHAEQPVVRDLLTRVAAGKTSVAVALDAESLTAELLPGGDLRVRGQVGPVLGAGSAAHFLLGAAVPDGEVWFLIDSDHADVEVHDRTAVDFSRSLADVRLNGVLIPAEQRIGVLQAGGLTGSAVRDAAAVVAAAEASGVARWCLRTATEYAAHRQQFGRPIGSFQAVKHLCAAMLCQAERAAASAWDAARAFDQTPQELPLAAAVAAALALAAAVQNAKDCIQVLGGVGFTWEHDAHLYLRRAIALRQLLGGEAFWRARAADLVCAGVRRSVRLDGDTDAPADHTRSAVRERAERIAAVPAQARRVALADAGYLAPQWPAPYGLDASARLQLMIDEELDRAGVTRPDIAIAGWAVPTLLKFGTAEQQERFVGPSLRGEITWCQLFSEPEAGSDLASLRTRAVRVDGGWRLTGQKVWTSLAAQADWGICLARTDAEAPQHRGLTYFLVPMHTCGILIRPLRDITGRSVFNEVFLDDVYVADECVVALPGEGWQVARGTLESERVAIGRGSSLGETVEQLIHTVAAQGLTARPGVQDRLGALVAEGLTLTVMDLRAVQQQMAAPAAGAGGGAGAGTSAAVRKLMGVAHRQAVAEAALEFCGPQGAAADGPGADPVHEFLLSRCLSIAGGTTQILMTVVAERELGLPRERVR